MQLAIDDIVQGTGSCADCPDLNTGGSPYVCEWYGQQSYQSGTACLWRHELETPICSIYAVWIAAYYVWTGYGPMWQWRGLFTGYSATGAPGPIIAEVYEPLSFTQIECQVTNKELTGPLAFWNGAVPRWECVDAATMHAYITSL